MYVDTTSGPVLKITRRPCGGVNLRRNTTRIALTDAEALALADALVDAAEAPDA